MLKEFAKKKDNQQTLKAQEIKSDMGQEDTLFATTYNVADIKSNVWMIDSGCSNHMTHEATIFKNLDKSSRPK